MAASYEAAQLVNTNTVPVAANLEVKKYLSSRWYDIYELITAVEGTSTFNLNTNSGRLDALGS